MIFRFALLYAGLALGANLWANTAFAEAPDLSALATGEMNRLAIHAAPKPLPDAAFTDPDGNSHSLADWHGKVVLLNFWQVSCAPCREEMPALNTLQRDYGGDDFAVLPLAFGYNRAVAIPRFYSKYEITDLPILLDPKSALSAPLGIKAAPVTLLLDRDGHEIARFIGGGDWASPEARALIETMLAEP